MCLFMCIWALYVFAHFYLFVCQLCIHELCLCTYVVIHL